MRKYTKKLKQGLALLLALTFIVSSIPLSNVKAAEDPNTTLGGNPDRVEVVPEEHKHTYDNKKYNYNEASHWLVCDDKECSAEDTDNAVAHIYGDNDEAGYTCTVCGYEHVHTYTNNVYGKDATNHWLICDDESCPDTNKGKTGEETPHVYGNADGAGYTCTVCGYEHEHTYTTKHNDTYHWYECIAQNCPYTNKGKKEEALHVYGDTGEASYTCQDCGYVDEGKKADAVHEHTYTTKHDATNHWLICDDESCPDTNKGKKDVEAHVYDNLGNDTYKCKTCGYSKTHEHEYYFSVYNYDETNHWLICQWESCPAADKGKKDEAFHVYGNLGNDKYGCTVCDYISHEHTYTNKKYNHDATNHWLICDDENCPAADKGKKSGEAHEIEYILHINGNPDEKCKICGYVKYGSHSGQPTTPQKVFDITNSELVSAKNPINVGIGSVNKTLEELLGISSSEKAQGVNVWLSSENITSTVSDTDKQLIAKKKGNGTVAMYLDLSLYKRVGTNEPSKVTELTGDLSVTVDLPEEIIKDNRTFSAVRVHNGVAEKLPVKLDTNKKTGTFQTTGFSTYAIVYEDTPASPNTGSTSGSTSNTTTTATNTTTTSTTPTSTPTKADETLPDTGDSSNIMLWASLTVVLAVVILIIKKKELDTKQD